MSDNNLYALVWILIAGLLCTAIFKGCESDSQSAERAALKEEAERNAAAFAQSDCTRKGGTMYGTQCVVCGGK
jgi:hypothetical protein